MYTSLSATLLATLFLGSGDVAQAPDNRCPADITITEKSQLVHGNIGGAEGGMMGTGTGANFCSWTPVRGFQGVSVKLTGGEWQEEVWLQVKDTCFSGQTQWWEA